MLYMASLLTSHNGLFQSGPDSPGYDNESLTRSRIQDSVF